MAVWLDPEFWRLVVWVQISVLIFLGGDLEQIIHCHFIFFHMENK